MMFFLIAVTAGCSNASEVNLDFANLGWIDVIILGIVQGITELLPIRGSVTEAVTRGKVARKYYETTVSAFMMIWDSDAYGGLSGVAHHC